MSEHDPRCYQSTGVPDDLPGDLCDCGVWRLFAAVPDGYTCPTECVTTNHPGREHADWLTTPTADDRATTDTQGATDE